MHIITNSDISLASLNNKYKVQDSNFGDRSSFALNNANVLTRPSLVHLVTSEVDDEDDFYYK